MINMKKSKGLAVALVMSFVAVVAVVGITTFNRYERRIETEQAEKQAKEKEDQRANTQQIKAELEKTEEKEENLVPEVENEKQVSVNEDVVVNQPIVQEQLTFSQNDTLVWPVDGNVILNYSMDQTTYFATLEQYKYNPALIISGNVGDPVQAAANGRVIGIETNAQTGNTVSVDIGNGYELVYGQLDEMRVVEGQKIEEGQVIGYLNEPTKYYSVEGCNLYFKLLKDGEPQNPLEYMEE